MLILGKSIFNNWSGFGFGLQSFHHIQPPGQYSRVIPQRGPPATRSGYVHPGDLRTGRSRDAVTVKTKEKKKKRYKDSTSDEGEVHQQASAVQNTAEGLSVLVLNVPLSFTHTTLHKNA